jgi:hypothetical protein
MTQLLSKIHDRHNMSLEDCVNYCIDNGITDIVNDYGYGITVGLNELEIVWDSWKKL